MRVSFFTQRRIKNATPKNTGNVSLFVLSQTGTFFLHVLTLSSTFTGAQYKGQSLFIDSKLMHRSFMDELMEEEAEK